MEAERLVHELAGLLCHQLPARSPQFADNVFPLCFRCAGLHFGLLSAYCYLAATGGWARRLPTVRCGIGICLLTIPLQVDGLGNALHLWASPGWLRAVTGLGVGIVLPMLLVPLRQESPETANTALRPSLGHPAWLVVPIGIGLGMLWLLGHPGHTAVFQLLGVVPLVGMGLFAESFLAGARRILRERRREGG